MTALLGALAVVLVLVAVLVTVRTATRLDRLHVRTDASWSALDGTLVRRAVVVRILAAASQLPVGTAGALRAAADRALAAPGDREAVENELGRLLGELDRAGMAPALGTELADAEQRVVLARRVYNDAVRDTRALRSRRAVRWPRLAGTAPRPRFFEIAEPVAEQAAALRSSESLTTLSRSGRSGE